MNDWELMLLEWYCEALFDANGPAVLAPALDARFAGWQLVGHVIGRDVLLPRKARMALAPRDLYYGLLLRSVAMPKQLLCLVRGTATFVEWIEDGEFLPMPHPIAGEVETGFYSAYHTLYFRALDGSIAPLVSALTAEARAADGLMVVGHSLGAAMVTYLVTELADARRLGTRVRGRFIASPRPGDRTFGKWAVGVMGVNWAGYAYEMDHVPRVPIFFNYAPLPGTEEILAATAKARIAINPRCSHHVVCYAALLGGQAAISAAKAATAAEQQFLGCVLGAAVSP